jgi:hypothetical protein
MKDDSREQLRDPGQEVSSEEVRRAHEIKVKLALVGFYDALEKACKRHRPENYIRWMTQRLSVMEGDASLMRQTPPHVVLHSIEANCAFWKTGYDEPVQWDNVLRIMNVYHGLERPWDEGVIGENIDRWFAYQYRIQIVPQMGASREGLARACKLLVAAKSMQPLIPTFGDKYGLTPMQWIQFCFLTWTAVSQNANHTITEQTFTNCDFFKMEPSQVQSFLGLAGVSVAEIKTEFLRRRRELKPHLQFALPSILAQRPLVAVRDNAYVCPHPNLLFGLSEEGLYRLYKSLDGFGDCIGPAFEEYAEDLLKLIPDCQRLVGSKALENASNRKSCDFCIETGDAVVMVECKAVSFVSQELTDAALMDTGYTTRVAEAVLQIHQTAQDIASGLLDCLQIDGEKLRIGIIVTFGRFSAVNSPWYVEEILKAKVRSKAKGASQEPKTEVVGPFVVSVEGLESLATLLYNGVTTLRELVDERVESSYHTMGSWDTFLDNKLHDEMRRGNRLKSPPFIQKQLDDFFGSLGVSRDQLASGGDDWQEEVIGGQG